MAFECLDELFNETLVARRRLPLKVCQPPVEMLAEAVA